MRIVQACASDADQLTDIAGIAKRHWGYPAAWMEHWSDVLCITPKTIESVVVKKALFLNEVVGFYGLRASDPGCIAWLDHLWVLPNYMNLGWGIRSISGRRAGRITNRRQHDQDVERSSCRSVLSTNGGPHDWWGVCSNAERARTCFTAPRETRLLIGGCLAPGRRLDTRR